MTQPNQTYTQSDRLIEVARKIVANLWRPLYFEPGSTLDRGYYKAEFWPLIQEFKRLLDEYDVRKAASALTKAPEDGGRLAVALHSLWEAELAYDAGKDGAARKAAWSARNEALDTLAKLGGVG